MKKGSVPFRLARIETHEYAVFEDNLNDGEMDGGLKTSLNFAINDEFPAIECLIRIEMIEQDKPIIVVGVSCEFEIISDYWEGMKNAKKTSISIAKGFAQHIAVITIGTLRGVLHAKTENTVFNDYFLPTIDVTEMIDENIKFDLD